MRCAALSVLLAVVLLSGCGGSSTSGSELVVGTISQPAGFDGALVSDQTSLLVVSQIFEGLTALAPGTTRVVPRLALRWSAGDGGRTWTFLLRRGVRFQDGTAFDARAVCANFDRWYSFRGTLQNAYATYYWHEVFGGFRSGPAQSRFRACGTAGPYVVRLLLRQPFGALPAALALPSFAIASPSALARYHADDGTVLSDGTFQPKGSYAVAHPTGTGPFRFGSWSGGQVTLLRNADYWGPKARVERLVFRTEGDSAARVAALQSGQVDVADLFGEQEVADVRGAPVRVLLRPPFDIGYLGVNQLHAPLGSRLVREALAAGIDRAAIVRRWYMRGASVASQFTPPTLAGYAPDVHRYPYDPQRARRLLRRSGLKLPVRVDLWYPTGVRRPYLPAPAAIARHIAADLDRSGFRVVLFPRPWLPDYIRQVRSGSAGLYLLGWVGDYADAGAFLDPIFGQTGRRFGFTSPALAGLLDRARAQPDPQRRAQLYRAANRRLATMLPGVPIVTTRQPVGVRRGVRGFRPSPLGFDSFAGVAVSRP